MSVPPPRSISRSILLACLLATLAVTGLALAPPNHAVASQPTHLFVPLIVDNAAARPPSEVLIGQAVARGEIDGETALLYRIYAVFDDARLPARFQGDDSRVRDSSILAEVEQQLAGISPQTQALLAPFLLPPYAPGSWLELQGQGPQAAGARPVPGALPVPAAITWGKVPAAGNKAVVWYQTRYPGEDALARALAGELTSTIWPSLTGLMEREPLSDAGQPNNGGDGRIDFYLVHLGAAGDYAVTTPYPNYCKGMAGYVQVNSQKPAAALPPTIAHEFFHLLEYTYRPRDGCASGPGEYKWVIESTATWAEDWVYPHAQTEQIYASDFLDTPDLPLEHDPPLRYYGAYLWPFFLSHFLADGSPIRLTWENTESAGSREAWQRSIAGSGGFTQLWPEFTLRNWNQDPVNDYQDWDTLTDEIPDDAQIEPPGGLDGAPERMVPLLRVDEIEHLSARYYHITFTGDDLHAVTFYNGLTFKLSRTHIVDATPGWDTSFDTLAWTDAQDATKKAAAVRVILKVNGSWRAPEDWTNEPYKTFCRDVADEHVEEMVVIVSNSEWQDASYRLRPEDLPPTLFYSNIPCDRWQATVHSTGVGYPGGPTGYTVDASYVMHRGMREVKQEPGGASYLAGTWFPYLAGSGTVQMAVDFTDPKGCSHVGAATHDPLSGPGAVTLYVNNFALSGAGYRRYRLEGFNTVNTTVTCPNQPPGQVPNPLFFAYAWWADAKPLPPEALTYIFTDIERVSPDGSSMEATKSNSTVNYHWHFAPIAGP